MNKSITRSIVAMLLGNFAVAAAVIIFIAPQGIILGGSTGIALALTHYISFPLSAIRHHTSSFIKFVGTRTLDIYLIHYFFLPRFLIACSPWFHAHSSIVQFLTIMSIALIVLFLSLLVSYILRLSPFLAHYLFGATRER